MKKFTFYLRSTLLIFALGLSINMNGQILSLKESIDSTGTIDGYLGYYLAVTINGNLNDVEFVFEENGYVRFYAYIIPSWISFKKLPDSLYSVKQNSMNIGDSWQSYFNGNITICTVVDTETIKTTLGTFKTYKINECLKSKPDSLLMTSYATDNTGGVRFVGQGDTYDLTQFSIKRGVGFLPLAVGNWWLYEKTAGVNELRMSNEDSEIKVSPNPVQKILNIKYQIPNRNNVKLIIYDITGREVAVLVTNERQQAGEYSLKYNVGKLKSGVYFVKLTSDNGIRVVKFVKE